MGNYIQIEHSINGSRMYTWYCHLTSASVKAGKNVNAGQEIGKSGNTGAVQGSGGGYHLDFKLLTSNNNTRVDPSGWFNGSAKSAWTTWARSCCKNTVARLKASPDPHIHNYNTVTGYSYKSYNKHTVTKKCSCGDTQTSDETCAFVASGNRTVCSKCGKEGQPYGSNTVEGHFLGAYTIRAKNDISFAVDVLGGATGAGVNIQAYPFNDSDAQCFVLSKQSTGAYALVNWAGGSAKTVTPAGGSQASGANVETGTNNPTHLSKQWYIEKTPDGYYSFRNKHSNLYLDRANGGAPSSGQNICQYTGNGTDAQKFVLIAHNRPANGNSITSIAEGVYYVKAKSNPDYALDVKGGSSATGTNLQLYSLNKSQAQMFALARQSDGSYTLTSWINGSGHLVHTHDGSYEAYANVEMGNNVPSHMNKRWHLEKTEDGYYSFRNCLSNLYMDVSGGGDPFNGQNIMQFCPNGSDAQKFVLERVSLADAMISGLSDKTYTGSAIVQAPGVAINNRVLSDGIDCTVGYSNNVNVGTATVTAAGKGGFIGSKSATFKINPASIGGATVDPIPSQAYTSSAVTPKPKVTWNGRTLVEGADYTLSYKNNVAAGTATVTVAGKGNFNGAKSATFQIVKGLDAEEGASLDKSELALKVGSIAALKATVNPSDEVVSWQSSNGEIATVDSSGNVKGVAEGTATVTAMAKGKSASCRVTVARGSAVVTIAADIAKANVAAIPNQTYTGSAVTPKPVVKLGGRTLKAGTDYTISYKNNIKSGTATMTIKGKGNYAGSVSKTFRIEESGIPVYWVVSKQTGENMYSTDKNEVNVLCNQAKTWTNKGVVWYAPTKGTPVYRLFSPRLNDHHYTTDRNEVNVLTRQGGWKLDGGGKAMWYSGGKERTYRLYSPARANAVKAGTHRFATSMAQVNSLKKSGWQLDDVKMYAIRVK